MLRFLSLNQSLARTPAVPTFSPTTRYSFLAESNHLALQRQFVFVDDGCIYVGAGSDGEASLGNLVGNVIAGNNAEVVALHDVVLGGKTDGKGLLQTDIVGLYQCKVLIVDTYF